MHGTTTENAILINGHSLQYISHAIMENEKCHHINGLHHKIIRTHIHIPGKNLRRNTEEMPFQNGLHAIPSNTKHNYTMRSPTKKINETSF